MLKEEGAHLAASKSDMMSSSWSSSPVIDLGDHRFSISGLIGYSVVLIVSIFDFCIMMMSIHKYYWFLSIKPQNLFSNFRSPLEDIWVTCASKKLNLNNSQRICLIEAHNNSELNNELIEFWVWRCNANTYICSHCSYCSNCIIWNLLNNCPYCDQVSTRRSNISTHIQRKHKGLDDPFKLAKKIVMTDPLNLAQNTYDFSNSFLPRIDYSDILEVSDRRSYIKNLSKELSRLSTVELCGIINEIRKFPQFKMN